MPTERRAGLRLTKSPFIAENSINLINKCPNAHGDTRASPGIYSLTSRCAMFGQGTGSGKFKILGGRFRSLGRSLSGRAPYNGGLLNLQEIPDRFELNNLAI